MPIGSRSKERLKSIYHNIPRMFFELSQADFPKGFYLFYYFNLPYAFPLEKFPPKVTVELTNKCNFECTHCHRVYANAERTAGEIDFVLCRKIVDEVAGHRGRLLKIGGWGEPSLHPRFQDILRYCTEKGVRTTIFSNGTFFRTLSFPEILAWSRTVIEVSIDGSDEESYLKIRRGGDYRFLKDRIRELFAERTKRKRTFPKIVVQHVVLPGESSNQLRAFRDTWRGITDALDFCRYNPKDYILGNKSPEARAQKKCKRIRRELSVFFDGRVPICGPQVKHRECGWLGNVKDRTIRELWNSPRMTQIRGSFKKGEVDRLSACQSCIYFR